MAQHTVVLQCIGDAYVDRTNELVNYGAATNLLIGGESTMWADESRYASLLKFDISSLPLRKKIESASLKLQLSSSLSATFGVVYIGRPRYEYRVEQYSEYQLNAYNVEALYVTDLISWTNYIDVSGSAGGQISFPATKVVQGYYGVDANKDRWIMIERRWKTAEWAQFGSRESSTKPILEVVYSDIPPDAPNLLDPIGVYKNNSGIIRLIWQYNSSVGDVQKGYNLQWSTNGVSWSTISATSPNNYHDAPAAFFPSGTIYWRVQAINEYDEIGPYSGTSSFYAIGAPPVPSVNSASPYTARPVIGWTSSQQQVFQVRVLNGNGAVVYDSGSQPGVSVTAHKVTTFLPDGSYTAQVRVKNQYDLWSEWGSLSFSVSVQKPGKPSMNILTSDYGVIVNAIGSTNPQPELVTVTLSGYYSWGNHTSTAGVKRLITPTNQFPGIIVDRSKIVLRNPSGDAMPQDDNPSGNPGGSYYIDVNNLVIAIPAIQSGWGDAIYPSEPEREAFLNGWKMYTDGQDALTNIYNGTGNKKWVKRGYVNAGQIPIDGYTNLEGTQSLGYVNGLSPYKFTYPIAAASILSYILYRSEDGTNFIPIAKNATGSFKDNTGKSGKTYSYFVRVVSSADTYIDSDIVTGSVNLKSGVISQGPKSLEIKRNIGSRPQKDFTRSFDSKQINFVGRPSPVIEYTEHINQSLQLACFMCDDELDQLLAIYNTRKPVMYRNSRGIRMWSAMSGLTYKEEKIGTMLGYTVSLVLTEVDYNEEVTV